MPKVLVVDDEESLLEAVRYALSREGFEVVRPPTAARPCATSRPNGPTWWCST